ncbi:glycoside hydrolase family 2 protein [Roseburia faecis]|jgi:beta-mannosidase|uniref:Beta-mannosidase B n=1 Tax=Roseburia faecis TaxID=301302 RepID=A0A844KPM5_9FIRM|nr:glycoside hydrolase family 2 protein [Roseburia faecis]MTR81763.1 glycoside hydrolase family 2 protein [Roseburia faecis]MTR91110.1 glycoside hydrolase family 2 protein [Roseburia faecis]
MQTCTLNGTWQLSAGHRSLESVDMQIPGTVLSGLLAAGKIKDPFYRTNEDATRALFWKDYVFTRTFDVDEELLAQQHIVLVCEGLDTLAEISINGTFLAKTDNMHRTWKFQAKKLLHPGKNEIQIVFRSVLRFIEDYSYEAHKKINYIPCGSMKGNQLLRKAHSMFGWDWGPQTIDAGIFRDIYLQGYSHARIEDIRIHQQHAKNVSVQTSITLSESVPGQKLCVELSEDGADKPLQTKLCKTNADGVAAVDFVIENPKLWWPNDYGDQPLYIVRTTLLDEDGTSLESITRRIGLRTLTISQEKDEWGNEFAFCVNGVKIFTRGGNYIPDDCLYTRITEKKLDYILESCRRAHFNCVRVWGGGYYPSDAFYDLCDEKGLIVWQDLMYACNVYDVTDAFAENCRQETYDNVRRLRHHASLGLWCGNNEIESAWDHWGDFQKETPYLRADYIRLFEEVLPKAVQEADGETFYWHSSPSSGGCFDNPDDANRGDTHYWDVWHGQKPFTDYRKYFFRFCSEFGFQSFPCAKTVNSFTLEDDRNIFSRVMESHQKNDAANGKMLYYLSENLRYPKDLTHLLYASQVLQGMAIKYGVDHWRRNRGRCMGTLYWQINDDWPAPSWSSIDYFGRWKALHYMAQKFYAPHAVSMTLEDHRCHVYFSNESFETTEYSLTLSIRDLSGNVLETYETKGNSPAFSAIETAVVDICSWEDQKDDVFLEAVIHTKDQKVLKDVETLVPYKYLNLKNPVISTEAKETNDAFILHISSDCFAPFVALDFDDADVIFSDNFFHLTDKTVQDIIVKKEDILQGHFENAEDFRKRLQILSLGTSYARS